MSLASRLEREWVFLRGVVRTLSRVHSIAADSPNLITDDLERAVDRWRERPALSFEGQRLSYGEMDAVANRFAHWADDAGLRRGDVVAILLPNRLDYLPIWFGLSKVGVVAALINNQLAGEALSHCLNVSGAVACIVDAETAPAYAVAKSGVTHTMREWTLAEARGDQHDLGQALRGCSDLRPDRDRRAGLTGARRRSTSSPAARRACPRPRASPTCAPSSTCAVSPAPRTPSQTTVSTSPCRSIMPPAAFAAPARPCSTAPRW